MGNLLFLCTGNYYRSRFAEILFNWHANQQDLPWRAESRGLELNPGNLGHMSEFTIRRLNYLQVPISQYLRFPKDLTCHDLGNANHIVAVKESEHRPLVSRRFPEWLDKIEYWEIHDIDFEGPEVALPQLELRVTELLQRIREFSPESIRQ
jgi:protein-tyrosine phosphatase